MSASSTSSKSGGGAASSSSASNNNTKQSTLEQTETKNARAKEVGEEEEEEEEEFEKNETIAKIEELIECLLASGQPSQDDSQSMDTSAASVNGIWFTAGNNTNNNASQSGGGALETSVNIAQMPAYTYAELLALYEKEKTFRLDLEITFQQKSKDSNKQASILSLINK